MDVQLIVSSLTRYKLEAMVFKVLKKEKPTPIKIIKAVPPIYGQILKPSRLVNNLLALHATYIKAIVAVITAVYGWQRTKMMAPTAKEMYGLIEKRLSLKIEYKP